MISVFERIWGDSLIQLAEHSSCFPYSLNMIGGFIQVRDCIDKVKLANAIDEAAQASVDVSAIRELIDKTTDSICFEALDEIENWPTHESIMICKSLLNGWEPEILLNVPSEIRTQSNILLSEGMLEQELNERFRLQVNKIGDVNSTPVFSRIDANKRVDLSHKYYFYKPLGAERIPHLKRESCAIRDFAHCL
jgi:hypothetical protein